MQVASGRNGLDTALLETSSFTCFHLLVASTGWRPCIYPVTRMLVKSNDIDFQKL